MTLSFHWVGMLILWLIFSEYPGKSFANFSFFPSPSRVWWEAASRWRVRASASGTLRATRVRAPHYIRALRRIAASRGYDTHAKWMSCPSSSCCAMLGTKPRARARARVDTPSNASAHHVFPVYHLSTDTRHFASSSPINPLITLTIHFWNSSCIPYHWNKKTENYPI